jgi:hypothetical protein
MKYVLVAMASLIVGLIAGVWLLIPVLLHRGVNPFMWPLGVGRGKSTVIVSSGSPFTINAPTAWSCTTGSQPTSCSVSGLSLYAVNPSYTNNGNTTWAAEMVPILPFISWTLKFNPQIVTMSDSGFFNTQLFAATVSPDYWDGNGTTTITLHSTKTSNQNVTLVTGSNTDPVADSLCPSGSGCSVYIPLNFLSSN